jgi:hypothetical protein
VLLSEKMREKNERKQERCGGGKVYNFSWSSRPLTFIHNHDINELKLMLVGRIIHFN